MIWDVTLYQINVLLVLVLQKRQRNHHQKKIIINQNLFKELFQNMNIHYNNDIFCANILEDQAQWHDKTKGLSKLVIVKQCVSRQWIDEEARRLRRIGSIKEIGF